MGMLIDDASDGDIGAARASLTAAQRRVRAGQIRDAAFSAGMTQGWLLAGIADAETQMSHCWSELTWACQGPYSSDCGGPVVAGAGDGPCSLRQGGIGMFQFDAGTFDDTLRREGTRILSIAGNTRAAVDFVASMVVRSAYVPGVSTRAQAISWMNGVRIGNGRWVPWIKTVTHYYNGCAPSYSCWSQRYAHYRDNTSGVYHEMGASFWVACRPSGESCNNRDDDCDGRVDESLSRRCGSDVGACRRGTQTCRSGSWGGCAGEIRPRGESCNNVDDDCDRSVDEAVRRGCGTDVGECVRGEQVCRSGGWGSCDGGVDPVPERCDMLDNDCDGASDDQDVCEIEELVMQGQLSLAHTDIDGDGKSDACACSAEHLECYLATGHGFEREVPGPSFEAVGFADISRFSTLRMGDIDGDGRADACLRGADGVRCWTSAGGSFDVAVEGPALSDAEGFDRAPYFTTIRLADVDGDGMADLCARFADGLRCYLSTGRGFGETLLLPDLADDAGFAAVEHYGTLRMGDIDGDGRVDVCARGADGVLCWRSSGRGFPELVLGPAWTDAAGFDALDVWSTIRLADVDGDGRADLCARTPSGFQCHPSTGRGFGDPYLGPALADGWDDKSHYATLRMGDVDGDGRADLCGRSREGIVCWLFNGHGFERRIEGPALSDDMGWREPSWFRTIRLADVNGDGRADLCARDDAGLRCWRSDGHSFPIELSGPVWADGWDAPHRFGTIRLDGVGGLGSGPLSPPAEPLGPGCSCSAPGATAPLPAWPLATLPLLPFLFVFRARRRRRTTEAQRR